MEKLDKLRKDIDHIDRGIMELIGIRAEMAKEIGKIKKEHGMQVEDMGREKEILDKVSKFEGIFRQIIEYCKNEERK